LGKDVRKPQGGDFFDSHCIVRDLLVTRSFQWSVWSLPGQWSVVSGQFGQTDQLVINETTTPTHLLVT